MLTLLVLLPILLGTQTSAYTFNADPPAPAPAGRALKQHHVPRTTTDTCAHVTGDDLQNSAGHVGVVTTDTVRGLFENMDLCLCSSLLPLENTVRFGVDALAPHVGQGKVDALLAHAVNNAQIDGTRCKQCSYPAHAIAAPTCGSGGLSCGWNCQAPYVQQGNQCVCPHPWTECNGICGWFPRGCGSATPWKRDTGKRVRTARGLTLTLANARATCNSGESVCGVYGGSSRGFECVDTDTTLESCGGCAIPNPFLEVNATSTAGTDCSSLQGVQVVSCVAGKCAVSSCLSGWAVTKDGDACARA